MQRKKERKKMKKMKKRLKKLKRKREKKIEQNKQDFDAIEHIIMEELEKDLIVGSENDDLQLPVLQDSRISMGKIQEAQRILSELGLPPAHRRFATRAGPPRPIRASFESSPRLAMFRVRPPGRPGGRRRSTTRGSPSRTARPPNGRTPGPWLAGRGPWWPRRGGGTGC